jgi:ribonuclease HIII
MYLSFDELSDKARVWIYQSDRKITDKETQELESGSQQFAEQWAAHGTGLTASAKVFHNQFLVLAVDESAHGASGCSIDSSVAFVKQAEQRFGINFFDRTKVAFLLNDKIYLESIQNLKNKIEIGEIVGDTLTFNNLVATKEEMNNNWLAPAQNTWLERYF